MTGDPSERRAPPDSEEEWAYIWRNLRRVDEAWPVIGPVVALVKNWKAAVAILLFVVWLNRPEILEALKTIVGAK